MKRQRVFVKTKGYWPLPLFVEAFDGKWHKLKAISLVEKNGEYACDRPLSPSRPFVLVAEICKALPKKVEVRVGGRRIVLSRWMGGIYANLDAASQRQVGALYDAIAGIYRYHVEPGREGQLAALAQSIPDGALVIDASAGDCTLAILLERRCEVWCADINKNMLALSDGRVGKERRVVCSASALARVFGDGKFDVVAHTFSNTHRSDRKFFSSFNRVLKSGGMLLYHPVKAPGEQWPANFEQKTSDALKRAGFVNVERKAAYSIGKKKSTLVYYIAKKRAGWIIAQPNVNE